MRGLSNGAEAKLKQPESSLEGYETKLVMCSYNCLESFWPKCRGNLQDMEAVKKQLVIYSKTCARQLIPVTLLLGSLEILFYNPTPPVFPVQLSL